MKKMDVDKKENHKGERVFSKKKFEESNNKQGGKGAGKGVAGKKKKEAICEKGKRKQVVGENGKVRDNNASDEVSESTDDDFVANVGAKHGLGMDKEKVKGRKKMDDGYVKQAKVPKVKTKLERIHLRNPQAYWLLDKFDADTCSLNVNSKTIMITAEVVRNLLGVPMGEVHINAREVTDFRNPLARKWKAQFGKDVKRHYNTLIANEIVEKGRSGWMFKINFLVLFFSTVEELNLSNTVNLKFIHCINIEDDILKLDWCTYIIECLIKTKRSWKRDGFFNGPLILLLVLYGHSQTPIKMWSSDMLNKLEADLFDNNDGCDTDVGDEADV